MAFTNNPSGNVIDRLRLFVGDADCNIEWLADETYQYLLNKHNNNEKRASREAMQYILFSLARRTHERAFQIEVWGDQMFSNYEKALKLALSNPDWYSLEFTPYASGISRKDMKNNVNDIDTPDSKLFRGMNSYGGVPSFYDKTVYVEPTATGL